MRLPKLCSLQNVQNEKYRCNHATKLESHYESPQSLFELLPHGDDTYAIKNVDNGEFYQCHITSLVSNVEGDCQLWKILPDAENVNAYTIQNVGNGKYMTSSASKLHEGRPGKSEQWVIEARGEAQQDLGQSFYGFLKNKNNGKYRCNQASKLKSTPSIPDCLTKFIKYDDGSYGIQNQDNYEFFQSSIMSMSKRVTSNTQKWHLISANDGTKNDYFIKNVENNEYMTSKAGQLHSGAPGDDEVWVIERYDCSQTSSWMGQNTELLSNKLLSEICFPASHDTGTYKEIYQTKYGVQAVTKTQIFDIQMQLMQGVRKLDLRPVLWNGDFYTAHYDDINKHSDTAKSFAVGFQGAAGVALFDAFKQVEAFISANKHELVILKFSHFINWMNRDDREDYGLTPEQASMFISLLQEVLGQYLIKGNAKNLTCLTINELLSKGNIIAVFPDDYYGIDPLNGVWSSKQLPGVGGYSNMKNVNDMVVDQEKKLRSKSHRDASFLMNLSWQLTLSTSSNISGATMGYPTILSFAKKANSELSPAISQWLVEGVINENYYPNTLQTDSCYEEQTQAVMLSLAITRQVAALLKENEEKLTTH